MKDPPKKYQSAKDYSTMQVAGCFNTEYIDTLNSVHIKPKYNNLNNNFVLIDFKITIVQAR